MTFSVIFIALLIERFFDWSHLRSWHWYAAWRKQFIRRKFTPLFRFALSVLPLLAVVFLLQLIFRGSLYGVLSFVFNLLVLLLAMGPHNLWADAFAAQNAIQHGDVKLPNKLLRDSNFDYVDTSGVPFELPFLFIAASRRVFATIFWFLFLGPVGALGYRLCAVLAEQESIESADMLTVLNFIEWLPVRLQILLFSLSGHFNQVLHAYRAFEVYRPEKNDTLLTECGMAAVMDHPDQSTVAIEKHIVQLIDRSAVIFLLMILVTSWLG